VPDVSLTAISGLPKGEQRFFSQMVERFLSEEAVSS
jgi:hypothetical protein